MASTTTTGAHILVFPFPAQGHILPLLDFTHQLALQNLSITILITPKNLPVLTPLLSAHPTIRTLILPFPNCPYMPSGVENMKDLPSNGFDAMMRAMRELYYPILHWFESESQSPSLILSDFFLGWTHHLACQLSIPRIVFCPSGLFTLSISADLWRDLPDRVNSDDPNEIISFPKVPNSPSYPWWQISPVYRFYKKGGPDTEFVRDGMLANLASWGIVFNSFGGLESVYLDQMKKVVGHERVWAVGPLIAYDGLSEPVERGGSISIPGNEILSWLDNCDAHSVVYVCFGSQTVFTNKQMEELALGLEQSGSKFIWAIKEPTAGHLSSEYGVIPDGFETRVKERGLVVKGWAPQVLILKHRAVGAFLTHCGWNSVLESLAAGVPMLGWPMSADQFMNATLLVDQVGVAVRVCEGEKTIPNATELAVAVSKSVSDSGFEKERMRARKLSESALGAVKEGGSSCKDLDRLVKDICGIRQNQKL
nr:glycosyltransferase [Helleborus thibetanus]